LFNSSAEEERLAGSLFSSAVFEEEGGEWRAGADLRRGAGLVGLRGLEVEVVGGLKALR